MYPFLLAAADAPATGPSTLVGLLPYFLMFLIFYVIWWMPLKKKQKAMDAMLDALEKGDKVVTNGGLYGEIAKVDGDVVLLKLNETTKVRVARRAIAGLEATKPAVKSEVV